MAGTRRRPPARPVPRWQLKITLEYTDPWGNKVTAVEVLDVVLPDTMKRAQPIALQLRFLQTMREISSEHNTTTFLPITLELFSPFLRRPATSADSP